MELTHRTAEPQFGKSENRTEARYQPRKPPLLPFKRQTDADVCPADWTIRSLEKCATFKTGPFGSTVHQSDYVENAVPFINPVHIVDGKLEPSSKVTVAENVAQKLGDFRFKEGDIVIARRGDMGRCAVVQSHQVGWLCGSGSMIIRCDSTVDPRFMQRVLSSPTVIASIEENSVGSTMINLNQSVLASLKIQLPPTLAEQQAIAEALSDADALIAGLVQLIAKKRLIKQGAMQALLSGRQRLPGFSGEWHKRTFGELAKPRRGRTDPRQIEGALFCIELEHIEAATGTLIGSTSTTTQSSLKSIFQPGDVLFGKLRAYLRKFWLADRAGVCSTEFWVLAPKPDTVSGDYLFQLVQTDSFVEAASSSYGTHMPRSDWNVVKGWEVSIPSSIHEMSCIATILSDMDAEILALEAKLAKARRVKQGMMQELLTGRIRLG